MTGTEALAAGYLHFIQLILDPGKQHFKTNRKCRQNFKPKTPMLQEKNNRQTEKKKPLPLVFQTIILQKELKSTEVERQIENFCFLLFSKLQVESKMQNCFWVNKLTEEKVRSLKNKPAEILSCHWDSAESFISWERRNTQSQTGNQLRIKSRGREREKIVTNFAWDFLFIVLF